MVLLKISLSLSRTRETCRQVCQRLYLASFEKHRLRDHRNACNALRRRHRPSRRRPEAVVHEAVAARRSRVRTISSRFSSAWPATQSTHLTTQSSSLLTCKQSTRPRPSTSSSAASRARRASALSWIFSTASASMSVRSPRRSTWSRRLSSAPSAPCKGQKVRLAVSDEPIRPTVYCTHGRLDGFLYCKRCPNCRAKHNLSYAEESTR